MAISSVYGYGTSNRVTGLVSGMDTDSIITSLLQAEQSKIDNTYRSKTKMEWKQEAYQSVYDSVKEFREKYLSALSSDNMWSASVYSAYKVNLESNRYLDVKATSGAFATQYTISKALKADYAEISGSKYISRG